MTMRLMSDAIAPGAAVPRKHTGDGQDLSPPLRWNGLPAGAKELALVCDDPDAPTPEPWVHWVIYKIPAAATSLPEGVPPVEKPPAPAGALQGRNTFGKIGYGGPAPPRGHGVHHYQFRLYALDTPLDLRPGLDKKALLAAMAGHILEESELVGTYER
jgi:Raf kinase inhibitor-like YbhB/YbcL family protein